MATKDLTRDALALFGRFFLAFIFFVSGIDKIFHFSSTMALMASKGIPFTQVLLVIAIIVELGGALMLLFGFKARITAFILILFVIVITLIFHNFWTYADAIQAQNQMAHFMKNIAIIGGLFYVMAFGAGRLSIGSKYFREE